MHCQTTPIITATEITLTGYCYKNTCSDWSIIWLMFGSYKMHALNYFASLGIFMFQGRRMQDAYM